MVIQVGGQVASKELPKAFKDNIKIIHRIIDQINRELKKYGKAKTRKTRRVSKRTNKTPKKGTDKERSRN